VAIDADLVLYEKTLFSAVVLSSTQKYQLPSFIRGLIVSKQLKWRVVALAGDGKTLEESKFSEVK